ncbi:dynamin ARC5 isoform X2 [Olea europaea subsp. europaea]|uniref:Dynamin ARC5 isoform X2 n=1 Tax=Olea europaea subsp. europaea TaxID=158383 RepID=A0A8S0QG40_OLEEU|nr:dynamin ARC5 isoform X2 [Olea europaea subsp. europaea]
MEKDSSKDANSNKTEPEMEVQWRLYEAYNELHGLAQEFETPFDAPAVLMVSHQTDGKSALVEALMGFQFNHVGGGTKTRCPITLHMKYNPDCHSPLCNLLAESDPSVFQEKSLQEIQDTVIKSSLERDRDLNCIEGIGTGCAWKQLH